MPLQTAADVANDLARNANHWYAAQTVILAITGLLVAIYTRATNKQLKLAQDDSDRREEEKKQASYPFIKLQPLNEASFNPARIAVGMILKVVPVHSISIKCIDGEEVRGWVEDDPHYFETDRLAAIIFEHTEGVALPKAWEFAICYITKLHLPHEQHYRARRYQAGIGIECLD